MFIANIGWGRSTIKPEYKKLGRLWYDPAKHHCSILLSGWRQGQAFAKASDSVEAPPYLAGDIQVFMNEYEKGESLRKEYLWCGFMWTTDNEVGHPIYHLVFEVDPTPLMVAKALNSDQSNKTGLFLSVHLIDKE